MRYTWLSPVLGVRCEGVTQVEGRPQEAMAHSPAPRHFTIVDRAALAAAACDCYTASRRDANRFNATIMRPTMTNTAESPAALRRTSA